MLRRLTALALVIAASFAFTSTAQAHRLSGHPKTLQGTLTLAKAQLNHDQASGEHHWVALDRAYVKKLSARVYAQRQASMLPPHYAGWWCIHAGAYPGAPHEGSSSTGLYTGPLQMTNPWLGYTAPGGSWNNNWSDAFWTAEHVAARYGFSYSFMKGQWPNTYPPCAGKF